MYYFVQTGIIYTFKIIVYVCINATKKYYIDSAIINLSSII